MNPEYVNVTPQQVGHKAANLGISGTPESLMEFALWVERMALASRNSDEETEVASGED